MFSRELLGRSFAALVAAGAMVLVATTAQASISPAPASTYQNPDVQNVACLLGAHIGPAGVCIGGYHHRHCWINRWGHRVCNW